jgi:hypothetical protein
MIVNRPGRPLDAIPRALYDQLADRTSCGRLILSCLSKRARPLRKTRFRETADACEDLLKFEPSRLLQQDMKINKSGRRAAKPLLPVDCHRSSRSHGACTAHPSNYTSGREGIWRVFLSAFSGRGFGPLAGLTLYSAPFGLQGDEADKGARIRPPITRCFGHWICA